MKKKSLIVLVYLLTFIVMAFNVVCYIKDSLFYTMDGLPQGEFLYSAMSPSGNYTLRVFKVCNRLGTGIRGELITLQDDGTDSVRNIYWQTDQSSAMVGWIDETVLSINDVMIDVREDYAYDCRREIVIPSNKDF